MEALSGTTKRFARPILELWLAVRLAVLLGLGPMALLAVLSAGALGGGAVGRQLDRFPGALVRRRR